MAKKQRLGVSCSVASEYSVRINTFPLLNVVILLLNGSFMHKKVVYPLHLKAELGLQKKNHAELLWKIKKKSSNVAQTNGLCD